MPHDLSHLGFLAGQIGRLIAISPTPVIAGDSFELAAVGALRLSPLRRGLAIDSTVEMFPFCVEEAARRLLEVVRCAEEHHPPVELARRPGVGLDRERL